jgi:hypothetical protein
MKNNNGGDLFGEFEQWEPKPRGRTRADQIEARWLEFHVDNPIVWKLVVHFAFKAINTGKFKNYGIGAIFELIRWHINVETNSVEEFKLSNDFRAYYARLFTAAYPQYAGFLRLRQLPSANKPAYENEPIQNTDPPVNEEKLMDRMEKLWKKMKGEADDRAA